VLAHLAVATDANAIGFKVWVQRNIAKPAQTVRQRLGMQDAPSITQGEGGANS